MDTMKAGILISADWVSSAIIAEVPATVLTTMTPSAPAIWAFIILSAKPHPPPRATTAQSPFRRTVYFLVSQASIGSATAMRSGPGKANFSLELGPNSAAWKS